MSERGIRLTRRGIELPRVGAIPFLSGSCHYWRLERSKWREILVKFKALGFPILQTYVPWSVHEVAPGQFDFGDFTPNKDLPAFLELCKELGIYVFLRPGPHINAELTYFGYPKRLFDNLENLAVSAMGTPVLLPAAPRAFPAISYSSEHFYKELGQYFDAFAKAAAPYCFPEGPVIGIQPDNEMSYFFRTAAYDQDYSHWARELYVAWLKDRYGELDMVRAAYGRSLASWHDLSMPKSFRARTMKDLPFYLDWCLFKEELMQIPLVRILRMLEERGFHGLLAFHNYPVCANETPFNISRAEKELAIVGVDFYPQKTGYETLRRQCLHLAGTSRYPVSPEFSSGCYQVWPPIDLDDQRFATMVAVACGLKGFNFYMAVERERWYGSPITRHGEYREKYADFYRRLFTWMQSSGILRKRRVAQCILLRGRDYDRLEKAADLLSPLPPLATSSFLGPAERCHEGEFDFDRCVQIDHHDQYMRWFEGLTRQRIPFVCSDTDINPKLLARYKTAVVVSFDFMNRRTQERLAAFAEEGGILVLGPDIPALDEFMEEYSTVDNYTSRPIHKLDCEPDTIVFNAGAGRIILVNGLLSEDPAALDQAVAEVARVAHLNPVYPADMPCDSTTFIDEDGLETVFVINPTDSLQHPRVRTDGNRVFVDMFSGEIFEGGKFVRVHMPPYTVRAMEVRPC